MHELHKIFQQTLVGGLQRKAVTTSSKWAEKYRVMSTPFAGLWTFNRHPWLRDMHDAKNRVCVGMKAAQMGYTETVLNITFYNIDILNRDCLYILPSKTPDASDFSAARFDAALELSPHLTNMFSNVKNVGHKRAGASNMYIRGSNSRGGLKSIPVSFIVFDEIDEFNSENIRLAEERVSGQLDWQMWKISTPTAPEHGIHKEFLLSTQDHFFFKCPHCSRFTELIFPDCLVVTADNRLDSKIKDSYIICKECDHKLEHETKQEWLKDGVWVPENEQIEKRGFYINQLYSTVMAGEPANLADAYLAAQVDKAAEQEFYNSNMGIPFVPKGAQVTSTEIQECIGNYKENEVVPENTLITMGVDQGSFLHYVICAWSFPRLGNDLNNIASCRVLHEDKCIDFSELEQLMKRWQVNFAVIDAQPERRLAFEFACKFWGYVRLCFYSNSAQGKMINLKHDDSWEMSVDRTSWLDVTLNRFHNKTIILPQDVSAEFRLHITKLVRRYETDKNNNPIGRYINIGADHFAHALVYSELSLPCAASLQGNSDIKSFL